MKLPWIKKPEAPLPDLREQLEAASAAHGAAVTAVEEAFAAFDDDPSTANEKALKAAREAEDLARIHFQRAERLWNAGKQREADEQRARDQRRADELAPMLTHAGVMARLQPLLDREMAAIEALAAVRVERLALRDELRGTASELRRVRLALGLPDRFEDSTGLADSGLPLKEAIEARINQLPLSPLRSLLRALMPDRDSYHHEERFVRPSQVDPQMRIDQTPKSVRHRAQAAE